MNKNLFFVPFLAGLAALTACSESDTHENTGVPDDNSIRFAAQTEFSRSKDINTNNLNAFYVYAYTGSDKTDVFMDNVEVTKTSSNTWTYSPLKYWPAKETVDFYAFAPAWLGTSTPHKAVAYDSYPGTEDIIYAVCPGLSGQTGMANAQVVFNFRHALAKVSVMMRSTNADLTVKVSNVALSNIMSKGNFTFPEGSTSETPSQSNVGTWGGQNTPFAYIYHMSQDASDLITLTTTPTDMGETGLGLGGAKYLIPQLLSYRSNGSGSDNYIAVMCSVYDTKTGAKLWPNENTPAENIVEGSTFDDGLLKFPLSTSSFSKWEPGYHYVYNLVINSNEEMGAIEFGQPSVDSYVDVETTYE